MSYAYEGMFKTLYDAVAKGDMETVLALLTDDIEFHVFGRSRVAGSYVGKAHGRSCYGAGQAVSRCHEPNFPGATHGRSSPVLRRTTAYPHSSSHPPEYPQKRGTP